MLKRKVKKKTKNIVNKSLKESCTVGLCNFYKFNGNIKYPNKINNTTLKMWFGRKIFESKSRKELIKDFLLDVKHKKGALELVFDYSPSALGINNKKYDGIIK